MREAGIDDRIGELVSSLIKLSRLLPEEDLHDMLGAIGVELDTAMELVLESRHRPRANGTVVVFPGLTARNRGGDPFPEAT